MELGDYFGNERRILQVCPLGVYFLLSLDYAHFYDRIG